MNFSQYGGVGVLISICSTVRKPKLDWLFLGRTQLISSFIIIIFLYRFGQLQAVDLESIEPSLRAGMHLGGIVMIDYCLLVSIHCLDLESIKPFPLQ